MYKWQKDAKIDHLWSSEAICVEMRFKKKQKKTLFPLQTNHLDLPTVRWKADQCWVKRSNELFDKMDEKVNKPEKINESVHTKLSNKTE